MFTEAPSGRYGIAKASVRQSYLRILEFYCDSTDWGTAGGTMGIAQILASIDHQIAQLERARALLGGAGTGRKGRGTGHAARVQSTRKKRKLTPEGRKRIAEAVKRRWEKQRKAAAAGQS
jgi:hypothetical protein